MNVGAAHPRTGASPRRDSWTRKSNPFGLCARSRRKHSPKDASGCANACDRNFSRKLTVAVRFFPVSQRNVWRRQRRALSLRTCVVELEVWYGYDPQRLRYGCPRRECWGFSAHQPSSPTLQDKLAFTLTATGSYEQAAAVATKWGCPADVSTLHALAQRLGARVKQQTQARLNTQPRERQAQRAATAPRAAANAARARRASNGTS